MHEILQMVANQVIHRSSLQQADPPTRYGSPSSSSTMQPAHPAYVWVCPSGWLAGKECCFFHHSQTAKLSQLDCYASNIAGKPVQFKWLRQASLSIWQLASYVILQLYSIYRCCHHCCSYSQCSQVKRQEARRKLSGFHCVCPTWEEEKRRNCFCFCFCSSCRGNT